MVYLLDTDVLIDRLNDDPPSIQLISRLAPAGLAISIITYMEVLAGVFLDPDPIQARGNLNVLLGRLPILPISNSDAERAAQIKADLTRRNRPGRRRALDLIIAATAIEHGLVLVTRNRTDYRHIAGLNLY